MAALIGYYHQKEARKKNSKNIEAKANLRLEYQKGLHSFIFSKLFT
ncbi:MAG: hypothetical protein QME57_03050 [Patescibacteria group bacterium]|nr:hypothetical protein [Patescibacteria group bacterium]